MRTELKSVQAGRVGKQFHRLPMRSVINRYRVGTNCVPTLLRTFDACGPLAIPCNARNYRTNRLSPRHMPVRQEPIRTRLLEHAMPRVKRGKPGGDAQYKGRLTRPLLSDLNANDRLWRYFKPMQLA